MKLTNALLGFTSFADVYKKPDFLEQRLALLGFPVRVESRREGLARQDSRVSVPTSNKLIKI
jgi:hypothetical protein